MYFRPTTPAISASPCFIHLQSQALPSHNAVGRKHLSRAPVPHCLPELRPTPLCRRVRSNFPVKRQWFIFRHNFVQTASRHPYQWQGKKPNDDCCQRAIQITSEYSGKGRLKQITRQSVYGKKYHHQHQHRDTSDIQPAQETHEYACIRTSNPTSACAVRSDCPGNSCQPVTDTACQHGNDFQHTEQNHQRNGNAENFGFGGR